EDTINEWGGTDTLVMGSGVTVANTLLQGSGSDLYVRFRNSSDSIRIRSALSGGGSVVESIRFADGTVWDLTQPLTFTWVGTSGNDVLTGSAAGSNIFDGGGGNDTLNGSSANDTYLFAAGYGNDTIVETSGASSTDTVRLVGLNPPAVTLTRVNADLLMTIAATGEVLKVQGHFNSTTNGIEQVVFADGTTYDRTTILFKTAVHGTGGNDTINGTGGDDVLSGDLGNDNLSGGFGNDIYLFNLGDGQDRIFDNGSGNVSEVDTLQFGAGIAPTDITASEPNNGDVVLSINGTTDKVTLAGQLGSGW